MREWVDVWRECRPWRPRGVRGFAWPVAWALRGAPAGELNIPSGRVPGGEAPAPAPPGGPGAPPGAPRPGWPQGWPPFPWVVREREGRRRTIGLSNWWDFFENPGNATAPRGVAGLRGPAVVRQIRWGGGGFPHLVRTRLEFFAGVEGSVGASVTFPDFVGGGGGMDAVLGVVPDNLGGVFDVFIPMLAESWGVSMVIEDGGPTPPSALVAWNIVYEELF